MSTVWAWIKRIFWVLVAAAAAVIGWILFTKSPDSKTNVDEQIKKIEAIENKTQEDLKKLEELRKKKEEIEQGIRDTANETAGKLDEIEHRPDKPGDAGRSSDDMNDAWGH